MIRKTVKYFERRVDHHGRETRDLGEICIYYETVVRITWWVLFLPVYTSDTIVERKGPC